LNDFVASYDKQIKALKEDVLRLVWQMRGSVSYSEVMMMGPDERALITKIAKDNAETTKKTGLPYF
jgi:hypothetical protein